MLLPLPQRQGIKTRQIYYPGEPSLGTDPVAPVGYVVPLVDEAGFGNSRGRTTVPVYKGKRRPDQSILGNSTSEGENPYGLETRVFPRLLKDLFGADGYVRPFGGTSGLHRFTIPKNDEAEMGSGQIQDESLETPKQIQRNTGVRPGAINLSYATEGVARYGMNFMGIGNEVNTDLGGTVHDFPYRAFSYFNGYAKLNGYFLTGMTDFSMTIDPGLARQEAAFHEGQAAAIGYGAINANGSLGLMFSTSGAAPENNMNFYDMATNEQVVPLDCAWANAPVIRASSWVRVVLASVVFSKKGFRPGGSMGKVITQNWNLTDDVSADHPAEKFNEIVGPWTFTAADNVLGIKVDGAAAVTVTLGTGEVSAETIAGLINANATLGPLVEATSFMGRVMIATKLKGSTHSVQIDTTTPNSAHTIMGFDGIASLGLDDEPILVEIFEPLENTDL